jgi:hypothetical protein
MNELKLRQDIYTHFKHAIGGAPCRLCIFDNFGCKIGYLDFIDRLLERYSTGTKSSSTLLYNYFKNNIEDYLGEIGAILNYLTKFSNIPHYILDYYYAREIESLIDDLDLRGCADIISSEIEKLIDAGLFKIDDFIDDCINELYSEYLEEDAEKEE